MLLSNMLIQLFLRAKTSPASPKAKKLMHVDEILDGFKKMPYSAFEELDKFFRSSDKGLQGGKKE
jgi:hypothetical protein